MRKIRFTRPAIVVTTAVAAVAVIASGGGYALAASSSPAAPPPAKIGCDQGNSRTVTWAFENPSGFYASAPKATTADQVCAAHGGGFAVTLSANGTQGPAGPAGPAGQTGPQGPAGATGAPGQNAAISTLAEPVDSVALAHIGGRAATNATPLTISGAATFTPPAGTDLVSINVTFCRDGAQSGSPDAAPNVFLTDQTTSTVDGSWYGPALLASNAQVNCGIESTVSGYAIVKGGDTYALSGMAYNADQSATGTIKVDYGSVSVVELAAS